MGAAPVASLGQLQAAIRARIGAKCQGIESIVDLFVVEVCRNWPERHMASLAKNKMAPGTGEPALDALCVIAAKCREQIEARWEPTPNTAAALNLLLQAVVVEFANLWFSSVQQRIALRAIITRARTLTT